MTQTVSEVRGIYRAPVSLALIAVLHDAGSKVTIRANRFSSERNHWMGITRTIATIACTLPLLLVVGGCLVSGSNIETVEGQPISTATLDQVVVGETSSDWVSATLGEPTSKQPFTNASGYRGEVWRYAWKRTESSSGAVLFVFGGRDRSVEQRTTYFEIVDGIVTRCWSE